MFRFHHRQILLLHGSVPPPQMFLKAKTKQNQAASKLTDALPNCRRKHLDVNLLFLKSTFQHYETKMEESNMVASGRILSLASSEFFGALLHHNISCDVC